MHLVQLLLPLYGSEGAAIARDTFEQVRAELVERFGGLTAYSRAPARGLWQEDQEHTVRDDVIIYEVMVETLDAQWWGDYRRTLESRFRQNEMIVRASQITQL